jgi:membrane fusion protein (multidrug efflux system)
MRTVAVVLVLAALAGGAWYVWHRPASDESAEAEPATSVAVHVGNIVRTSLRAYVTAYGVVEPEPAGENPAASASVAPSKAGVVVAVNCVEGQRVGKGEVLFQLDSRAADVAADFAERAAARQRRLIQIEGTSEEVLQNAEQQLDAARVQQALLRVESPLAGTVTRVNVKVGEAVDLATVMAEVVDLDRLVVSAQVPSTELAALEVGQPAEVALPGAASPLSGTLGFVSPQVDARTGTAEVRVRLPSGSSVRPGQFVTARIVSEEHADVLAVPVDSVVTDEDGASVISIVEGDTATRKRVTTRLKDNRLIEVEAEGLRPDMTVVTLGAYGLPEETQVRIVED